MSVVVARLVAKVEVVKLVGASACHGLSMVQVQQFFIEQTLVADRASPVLPGREGSFDGVGIMVELGPPARPLVPVLPQRDNSSSRANMSRPAVTATVRGLKAEGP